MRHYKLFLLVSATSFFVSCCGNQSDKTALPPPAEPWEHTPADRVRIDIIGAPEDERAVRSFVFYLYATGSALEIGGPFGNSNDTYEHHVFWDSDVWILPAILFIEPRGAKNIAESRMAMARIVGGKCRFPWEANMLGFDAISGPTKKAEHQSGDVMLGLEMAAAQGLVAKDQVDRIGKAVANHYLSRITKNEGGQSEIRGVTSVNEWVEGNNCLYTNAIADWTIKKYLGKDVDMVYPRNSKGDLVSHDGDRQRAYQQTAAPLVLWPLEREDFVDDPIAFLDRFEGKETPNGPAMSASVNALIRARYGNADDAYKSWRESWKKYIDGNPLMLFSERPGRKDLTYFSTGAAGCLNAVIYGFLGARIVESPTQDDVKVKMSNGKWLVFRPNLPAAWKSLSFKGLWVANKRYDVVCSGKTAKVTLADPAF